MVFILSHFGLGEWPAWRSAAAKRLVGRKRMMTLNLRAMAEIFWIARGNMPARVPGIWDASAGADGAVGAFVGSRAVGLSGSVGALGVGALGASGVGALGASGVGASGVGALGASGVGALGAS